MLKNEIMDVVKRRPALTMKIILTFKNVEILKLKFLAVIWRKPSILLKMNVTTKLFAG